MTEPTKKHRVLSIGGATFDLFARTVMPFTHIDAGSKVPIDNVIEACGGGAANTSVGMKRLGCDAFFCGVIGSDQWGDKLLRNFDIEEVNTSAATIVEGETTSFSIIIAVAGGDRIIFTTPGTNRHLQDATFDRELAKTMDWMYLNRLHEKSFIIQDDIAALVSAKDGPKFTWNPGGRQIEDGAESLANRSLLAHTTLLLVNREEALAFSQQETLENAHRLFHSLGVGISCITDGSNGTTAFDGTQFYRCGTLSTASAIVDTTGAGDAFGSGMTWALLHGKDLPNCLRAGTINATSVIGAIGAETELLTDTEMDRRLTSVPLPVEVLSALP